MKILQRLITPRKVWPEQKCIICGSPTTWRIQPENAPLCDNKQCPIEYLKNPSVYDPKGLHDYKTRKEDDSTKPYPEDEILRKAAEYPGVRPKRKDM